MKREYFLDVYGYVYRMEPVPITPEERERNIIGSERSVVVANWQGPIGRDSGSAKECGALIDRANAYDDLVQSVQKLGELVDVYRRMIGFDRSPVETDAIALLAKLESATPGEIPGGFTRAQSVG